jgi:glycosyltransferase involved in cell wall biosynthesis
VKIALFTPWPPQKSGIADYAYALAAGLLGHDVELQVFTGAAAPAALDGCAIQSCSDKAPVAVSGDAFPVFQLGNNAAFHAFQPQLLARFGGLVQLHDPVLHHLHVDRTLAAGHGSYWDDLRFWYGPAVAAACQEMVELGAPPWTNAAVTAIPLFEPYLQFADAVLVHSQDAMRRIGERLPGLRGFCLPQCYPLSLPPVRPPSRPERPLHVGVFGWIEPHKRLDQVLAAIATLRDRGVAIEVDICGPAGATMTALGHEIAALGLSQSVHLRGHLEHRAFLSAIAGVDLCINLRDPSMGETSAVVTQALQLGTPVIVTATGSYAELPGFALKVPAGPGATDALVAQLTRLHADRDELAALADATRRYAAAHLDFATVTSRYAAIIGELAAERARRRSIEQGLYLEVAAALAELDLSGSRHEQAIQAAILRTLTPCF